ncbi:MAG: hypothetical protein AB8B56_03355 [Crocinitomicaceae bacterium]
MGFGHLSALTILIPLATAGISFSKLNKTLKKLSVFVILSACTEASAILLGSLGVNNMPVSHIFTFLQVLIFAWIFVEIFSGWGKRVVQSLLALFIGFSILNWILWENFVDFNSNQRYVAAIVLIVFCTGYFVHIFVKTSIERIERDPYFWMCASLLLYTTGTLFLFIFGQEILRTDHHTYINVNGVLNILLNTGLTITLWLGRKK